MSLDSLEALTRINFRYQHALDEIDRLTEKLKVTEQERDFYFNQCKSYEMWQNRAIDRLKGMQ